MKTKQLPQKTALTLDALPAPARGECYALPNWNQTTPFRATAWAYLTRPDGGDHVAFKGESWRATAPSFGRDWSNLDQDGSDDNARFIDPLTLGELMLCIDCNLPDITPVTISAQFEKLFLAKTEEARQIFDDNLPAIVARAKAERRAH